MVLAYPAKAECMAYSGSEGIVIICPYTFNSSPPTFAYDFQPGHIELKVIVPTLQ